MKTNKLFLTIFIIASIGIISSTAIFYNHFNTTNKTKITNSKIMQEQLIAAENQIQVITLENNALHNDIEEMKIQLAELSYDLQLDKNKL